jgi:UDP-N-acetylmuramyl tripeptide synthase
MNLFGFSANNLPGNICLKIYPDILSDLQLPKTVIFMTGTNGKTATAIALSHFFRTQNLCVVNNNEGSNLDSGIISKLLKFTSLNGTVKADVAVLEVDEMPLQNLQKS